MSEENDLPVPRNTGGGAANVSDPIVFDTNPTVPVATPGTASAAPVADGREPTALASAPAVAAEMRVPGAPIIGAAATSAANPLTVSPGIDTAKEEKIGAVVMENLAGAWSDLFATSRAALNSALAYFAPLIARQAVLEKAATDEVSRNRASIHKRHLQGQALMKAGEYGIPLQQRQEKRFLDTIDAALNIVSKLA